MRASSGRSPGFGLRVHDLDRRAGGDEAQAQQVGELRAVGREQGRELALVGQAHVVLGAGRRAVEREPQRVVAQRVLEAVREAGVRPVEAEAGQLDAVAARVVGDDLGLQDGDGGVAGVGLQHVVVGRRRAAEEVGPLL